MAPPMVDPRTISARVKRPFMIVAGVAILVGAVGWTSIRPSNERDWFGEQRLLPDVHIDGDEVTIRNVRNFAWGPGNDVRARWETRRYALSGVRSVWYVLTPFSRDRRGPAHAFVSFGFADGQYVSISVEARREVGEEYSLAGGLLKRYELMYVIGDERDLIGRRVLRDDDVYVYPIRATRQQVAAMFTDMINRADRFRERPEFYGTLANNCTTNLLAHVNRIATRRIPYGRRILLPGYSDQLAHERGLIDTTLPLDEARQRFLVNERARRFAGSDHYSQRIRAQ